MIMMLIMIKPKKSKSKKRKKENKFSTLQTYFKIASLSRFIWESLMLFISLRLAAELDDIIGNCGCCCWCCCCCCCCCVFVEFESKDNCVLFIDETVFGNSDVSDVDDDVNIGRWATDGGGGGGDEELLDDTELGDICSCDNKLRFCALE